MKELSLQATLENTAVVTQWLEEHLENMDCPLKAQMQLEIAVDELFSNIARYAYGDKTGSATICVDAQEDPRAAILRFVDSGIPYDPLAKADPDVTLSAEEREIGGLGIYMVKKSMDEMAYCYENGQNILTIKKVF